MANVLITMRTLATIFVQMSNGIKVDEADFCEAVDKGDHREERGDVFRRAATQLTKRQSST